MEDESRVRVLLVDDHFIVRHTMRCILQSYGDIEVVGEASDGTEAIAYVGMFQPAVVLMDLHLKKMDGITAARSIKTQYPHVQVVVFSADVKDCNANAMQQAGAFEVLEKEDVMKNLYAAIQRATSNTEGVYQRASTDTASRLV